MRSPIRHLIFTLIFLLFLAACSSAPAAPSEEAGFDPAPAPTVDPATLPEGLIAPSDLEYLGAFRLPPYAEGASEAEGWEYGGQALTFYPSGDPDGEADGFPGSLYGTGNALYNLVGELSIPAPSLSRNLEELPVAQTLHNFTDITGGLFDDLVEQIRVAMEYTPAQDRLFLAWGAHLQEGDQWVPSHAWSNADLSNPDTQGTWWVGDLSLYAVNGYLFDIPQDFASVYLEGMALATGRYRDGGWSGMGPSLITIAPWLAGDPPAPGSTLPASTLLLYSNTYGEEPMDYQLANYQNSDEWEDGAWLTAGDSSAVVFVGSAGSGYLWYGFISPAGDGMPCVEQELTMIGCFQPDGSPCPDELSDYCEGNIPESRGWWSSRWDSQILFYDPADLAAVARGEMLPGEPQPYAVLDIDEHLFLNATVEPSMIGGGDQRRFRLGEIAYDRENGLLYIMELFADQALPVIHVWRVN